MNYIQTIRINFLLLFLLGFFNVFSQESSKAIELLDSVFENYQSFKNFSVWFDYSVQTDETWPDTNNLSEGYLLVAGNRYRAYLGDVEIINNGIRLYTILPEIEEVQIVETASLNNIPFDLIGLIQILKENYQVEIDKAQLRQERAIQYLRFTPLDDQQQVDYALVGVDPQETLIYSVILKLSSGEVTVIEFSDYLIDQAIDDSEFEFKQQEYPDYIIIE